MKKFISKSGTETKQIASNFAKTLKEGDIVLFDAEMGAGKTTFIQGIGEGLNISKKIISPTFNILKIYKGSNLTLYHFDCYRLENIKGDNGLDIYELLQTENAVFCFEWFEYLYDDLEFIKNPIKISIKILSDDEREITINE